MEYAWEFDGDSYMPITTDDPTAPNSIIELVSCNLARDAILKDAHAEATMSHALISVAVIMEIFPARILI